MADPTQFHLSQVWTVIGRIGDRPGMSEVYEVVGDGVHAVVKKIKRLPGAERELLVLDVGDCPNVIPFDEVVETDSEILIRMPKADKSLNQHLEEAGERLPETEVVAILSDLATALECTGKLVVHRDIKPQNALYLNGNWCLADFGLARYVEASTAKITFKEWGTAEWIAPERWDGRRATIKSDVYSLGIVAYQMATGRLPFTGPDLREQHRGQKPTPPSGLTSGMRSLILEMLAKSPAARPTPDQLLRRLAI
jgi:eukaryotic-like serine/threonine-protein kinase